MNPGADKDIKALLIERCKKLIALAKQRHLKILHILNKILMQLEESDQVSWSKFAGFKYVGPKILLKFSDLNAEYSIQLPNVTVENDSKIRVVTGDRKVYVKESCHTSKISKPTNDDHADTKTYKNVEDFDYVPGFNTTAYNTLKTLAKNDGLCKFQICLSNIFINEEVANVYLWSALNSLLNNKLIQKEGKRYYLTHKGASLCGLLFADGQGQKENKSDEIQLLIDSREMRSKNDRGFFERKLPTSKSLNLTVGDFLWIKGEYMINTIIERKRSTDFVSSLYDGRFTEQKNRLKNSGLVNCVYLVEGLQCKDSFIESAIIKTKLEGFIVIETKNIEETVLFVQNIDQKIREHHSSNTAIPSFASVSQITFYDFNGRNLKTKDFSEQYFLYLLFLSIKGITDQKAEFLSQYFKTFANLLNICRDKDNFRQLLKTMKIDGHFISNSVIDSAINLLT